MKTYELLENPIPMSELRQQFMAQNPDCSDPSCDGLIVIEGVVAVDLNDFMYEWAFRDHIRDKLIADAWTPLDGMTMLVVGHVGNVLHLRVTADVQGADLDWSDPDAQPEPPINF